MSISNVNIINQSLSKSYTCTISIIISASLVKNCPPHILKTRIIIKQDFDCKLSNDLLHPKPFQTYSIICTDSRCVE